MSGPASEADIMRAMGAVLDLDLSDNRTMQMVNILLDMRTEASVREGLDPSSEAAWSRHRRLQRIERW